MGPGQTELKEHGTPPTTAPPQVTELRGLSSLAVGAVTCDITEFFTTRPQVIVVDITELGTIKLQLEVLWK